MAEFDTRLLVVRPHVTVGVVFPTAEMRGTASEFVREVFRAGRWDVASTLNSG